MSLLVSYAILALAITLEVSGTIFMGKSEHFTKLVPTLICGTLYACSFYLLAQVLRILPLGIAYATWSGLGNFLVTLTAIVIFRQKPDVPAIVGITLIVCGVIMINGFSKINSH